MLPVKPLLGQSSGVAAGPRHADDSRQRSGAGPGGNEEDSRNRFPQGIDETQGRPQESVFSPHGLTHRERDFLRGDGIHPHQFDHLGTDGLTSDGVWECGPDVGGDDRRIGLVFGRRTGIHEAENEGARQQREGDPQADAGRTGQFESNGHEKTPPGSSLVR